MSHRPVVSEDTVPDDGHPTAEPDDVEAETVAVCSADGTSPRADSIFVVGNSRSGTTLLAGILSRHPDVYFLHETHFMEDCSRYVDTPEGFSAFPRAELRRLVNRMLTIQERGYPRRTEVVDYGRAADEVLAEYDEASQREAPSIFLLFHCFMTWKAKRHGASIPGEQTPRNIFHAAEISRAFPAAKFLHIVRDPRAVTLSQRKKWKAARASGQPLGEIIRAWLTYHPITIAFLWKRVIQEGDRLTGLLPDTVFHSLRFEDLCQGPEASVRKVCEFLWLPFVPEMLDVDECVSSNLGRVTYKGINPGVVGQWRGRLSETEMYLVERITGPEMDRLGYERVNPRPGVLALCTYLTFFPVHLAVAFALNLSRMGNPLTYLSRRLLPRRS